MSGPETFVPPASPAAPARGIMLAVLLSSVFWIGLAMVVFTAA